VGLKISPALGIFVRSADLGQPLLDCILTVQQ
jgi:hypothetical protein